MTAEQLIAGVREAVQALTTYEPEHYEIADAAGMVRELEVKLADWRRTIEKQAVETGPIKKPEPTERVQKPRGTPEVVAQGVRYELEPTYRTTYSFNTPRLLHDFATGIESTLGVEIPIGKLIRTLEKQGVLELRWKVSKLRQAAKMFGVVINTGHDAVDPDTDDLETPHVGEVKVQSGVKRVPLKEA